MSVLVGMQALANYAKGEIKCAQCWDTGLVTHLSGGGISPGESSSSIPCDGCTKGERENAKWERWYAAHRAKRGKRHGRK